MRTIEINEKLLQYVQDFYPEYDFLHMLFHLVIAMFLVVIVLRVAVPDLMNTNLTFYLALLTVMMYVANLGKDTFLMGYCGKMTDEAKVQLLLSIKSFIVVFALMLYTEGEVANMVLNLDVQMAPHLNILTNLKNLTG